jgi:hypothetical protein
VYVIIILFSLLNGMGEGMAQTSQGKYIADCATENNKGFFFSFFWACYMGSQVFGNLISAFVLGDVSQVYFVIIMIVFTVLSSILFFFLKEPHIFSR